MITLEKVVSILKSEKIEFSIEGDNITVQKLSALEENIKESICYYVGDNPSHLKGIERSIIICKPTLMVNFNDKNTYIFTKKPQLSFYHISKLFEVFPDIGINSQSIVNSLAKIGKNVTIGPFCDIEKCMIGDNTIIESGVKIYKGTIIGENVHIQSNSVIGATGVMWAWDENNNKIKCVQTGNTIIEDYVFIGTGVTIVKGAFENKPTIIGRCTMIAHGTAIGHGSIISEGNHFANNVSIAGSVTTEKNCFFGSGCIVRPHVYLSEKTIVGAGAVVVRDTMEVGLTLVGNPAKKLNRKKTVASGVPAPYDS